MAEINLTPNMNLPVPSVGEAAGPNYAVDINNCLSIIDQHSHVPGSGVPITPLGININSDLTFQNNNATSLRSVRFQIQGSPLSNPLDLGCLYESGVDLYYNDGNGNQIRMTQSGAVAGTPGSIANLVPPASATYVSADNTFVWQSAANTSADMDAGSFILRNHTANSKGLTLAPPNAMGADYTITLPALPIAQTILTLDNTGAMVAAYTIDGTTIVNNGGVLSADAAGLADGVTIQSVMNVLSVKNGYITYEFKLNGVYSGLSTPATEIDGFCFFNFNAEIVNIWAYSVTPGSGGTTEIDLKVASGPGGSFSSVFSTTPKFTSSSASNSYVDANGVVSPGTGVTAPVLASANLSAGMAMRMDIIQVMSGSAADCGIVIQFKQRN